MKIAICLNQISYVIAKAYTDKYEKDLIILYSSSRVAISLEDRKKYNIKKITRFRLGHFSLLSFFRNVDTILLPHHILSWMFYFLLKHANHIHYIDDGMDTLRGNPKNFYLSKYEDKSIYFSFNEYSKFGRWLENKKIVQVCSIQNLLKDDDKNAFDMPKGSLLIVESPGIPLDVVKKENIKDRYIFTHPSPIKQLNWDDDINKIDNSKFSVEKTMSNMRNGTIVIGETMSLLVYMFSSINKNVSIEVYLNDKENLTVVTKMIDSFDNIKLMG